jgi:hypothetical protein|tara:strand:- start:964 stop:1308 length:345 start_codon:yes stop_codon:yes gene_type:complete
VSLFFFSVVVTAGFAGSDDLTRFDATGVSLSFLCFRFPLCRISVRGVVFVCAPVSVFCFFALVTACPLATVLGAFRVFNVVAAAVSSPASFAFRLVPRAVASAATFSSKKVLAL